MSDNDDAAQAKLAAIKSYVPAGKMPEAALLKMAKLGAVIDDWMKQPNVAVTAVQCWTSIEEFLGIVPCTVMSMMSERSHSLGLRGRYPRRARHVRDAARQRARPPRCSIGTITTARPRQVRLLPLLQPAQALLRRGAKMDYQSIIAGTVGIENTYGTSSAASRPAP